MIDKKYQPTETEIKRFLDAAGSDPRTMAVAYLRARKRARDSEMAFKLINDLDAAEYSLHRGDAADVLSQLEKAHRRLKQHKDHSHD